MSRRAPFLFCCALLFGPLVRPAAGEEETSSKQDAGPPTTATLLGLIRENGTRKAVAGATVTLMGPNNFMLTAFTEDDGSYRFDGVPPGSYQLSVLAASYVLEKPKTVEVRARAKPTEANFFLTPDVAGGLFLEVEADREKRSVSTQKVQKEEIRHVPGTLGDPLRVIQLMPGVTVMNEVFADLIVQGGGPDENRIWLDRTPMAFPFHLLNSSSVLSGEFVETQTLHAAGFGVQYGNATGGVLEITSSDGKEEGIAGHGSPVMVWADQAEKLTVGRTEGSFQAGMRPAGAFLGSGRYLFPPPTIPAVRIQEGGPTFQFTPIGWDYQGKTTSNAGGAGTVRLLSYGSFDEEKQTINYSGPVPRAGQELTISFDFFQQKEFHTQGVLWDLPMGSTTSRMSLYRTEAIEDFKVGMPLLKLEDFIDRRETDRGFGGWEELEIRLGGHQTLFLGTQIERFTSNVAGVAPIFLAEEGTGVRPPEEMGMAPPRRQTSQEDEEEEEEDEFEALTFEPFKVEETYDTFGYYAEDKIRLFDRLTLAPGLRFERTTLLWKNPNQLHRDALMPRSYSTLQIFKTTKLRGGWGIYRLFPEVDQATDQGEVDEEGNVTRKFGNPYLLPERAEHFVFGVEQRLTDALRVEADVFHKRLSRLVVGEPERNGGKGFAEGAQFLLRHELTRRFFGWISYSYTKSRRRQIRSGDLIKTSWDQPHVLSVVGSVKLTPEWIVGATFRYTSGSPFTPIYNDEKRDPDMDEDLDADALPTEPNSGRLNDFHRLDLRVERVQRIRYAEVTFFLDAFNAYNRKNEIFRIPSFEDPSTYIPLTSAGLLVYGGVDARF
ncbi:MAG: TonB-dependent receptor [Nitrospirae bacterium]|nr:TonB-dependent receptor [Nitrospirota bacterium]